MSGILNEKEREVVEAVKNKFLEYGNELRQIDGMDDPVDINGASKYVVCELDNVVRELNGFDSELFIISVMGMLKSGKSSLINLLARSKSASPTGYGTDTTLRPALIMQATDEKKEGEIEVWLPQGNCQIRETLLASLFNCLRGIGNCPDNVRRNSYPLTQKNLKNILCKKHGGIENEIPVEPLMVVVRVSKDTESLLSSNTILLDTPGLDSVNSEWTKNGNLLYLMLLEKSDLILFLQSSVAPLNISAEGILDDLHSRNRKRPIWLVQNIMEAKHWLTQESIDKENEEQKTTALKSFQAMQGIISENYSVNLGKASPKVFRDENLQEPNSEECLYDASGLDSFVKNMRSALEKTAGQLRKDNCTAAVKAQVGDLLAVLEKFLEKNAQNLKTAEDYKVEIVERFNRLIGYINPDSMPSEYRPAPIRVEEISFYEETKSKFRTNEFDGALNRKFALDKRYKALDLNTFKNEQINHARENFRTFVTKLLPKDIKWFSGASAMELRKKISNNFEELMKKVSREFSEELSGIHRADIASKMDFIPSYQVEELRFDDYPPETWKNASWGARLLKIASVGVKSLTYSGEDARNRIHTTCSGNSKNLRDMLEEFCNSEQEGVKKYVSKWADMEFKRICRDYADRLEREKGNRLKAKDEEINSLQRTRTDISRIIDGIRNLLTKFDKI